VQLADVLLKNIKFYSRAETGHRIITNIKQDLPLVSADGEKIGQVIKNLIDNAIKYSRGGDIMCRASVKDEMVWIDIQDQGIGISEQDLPRIFDKFFRVERKETAHISGTGLGLSIAKYIIESHGGEIEVESQLGKGTTIGFGLPIFKD